VNIVDLLAYSDTEPSGLPLDLDDRAPLGLLIPPPAEAFWWLVGSEMLRPGVHVLCFSCTGCKERRASLAGAPPPPPCDCHALRAAKARAKRPTKPGRKWVNR
jgi:hypothetical protein